MSSSSSDVYDVPFMATSGKERVGKRKKNKEGRKRGIRKKKEMIRRRNGMMRMRRK